MSIKPQNFTDFVTLGCGRCDKGGTPECKVHAWTAEVNLLRNILQETGLEETIKWSQPCYTYNNKNVLLLSVLKEACFLGFFKGALLNDPQGLLVKPGPNSQAIRQLKFTSVKEIQDKMSLIKSTLQEAIELEKQGKEVVFKKEQDPIPEELEKRWANDSALKAAFEALTPGRQRGYLLYFNAPKQSKTRVSRIEKYVPKIMAGKGFHDR